MNALRLLLLFAFLPGSLRAEMAVWVGIAGDGYWSNSSNWLGIPVSAPDTTLFIDDARGAGGLMVNDLGPFTLGGLVFLDGSWQLSGDTLHFPDSAAPIENQSGFLQSIANELVVAGQYNLIIPTGTGDIAFTRSFPSGSGTFLYRQNSMNFSGGTWSLPTFHTSNGQTRLADGSVVTAPEIYFHGSTVVSGTGTRLVADITNPNWETGFLENAEVTIENGAFVEVGSVNIENGQKILVTGGTLRAGAGGATLGGNAQLALQGGRFVTPNLTSTPGSFLWTGGTLELSDTTPFTVGNNALSGTGSLTLNAACALELPDAQATVQAGKFLVLESGAKFQAKDALNLGIITADGATLEGSESFSNQGTILLSRGSILRTADFVNESGSQIFASGGVNAVFGGTDGSEFVNQGDVTVGVGSELEFYLPVSGAGSFSGPGQVVFNAGYSPGNSPAEVTFEGNLILGSDNRLILEIGGTERGAEYDALVIEGVFILGGGFELQLIDGFTPTLGNRFDLFDASAINGDFESFHFTLAPLEAGLAWDVTEVSRTGVVSVVAVPEPAVPALLGFATLTFLLRRHRFERFSQSLGSASRAL